MQHFWSQIRTCRANSVMPQSRQPRPAMRLMKLICSSLAFFLTCSLLHSELTPQVHVVIDAGHGGKAPSGSTAERSLSSPNNARSPSGVLEKDLTLELALLVEQALEKDIASDGNARVRAILTRRNDTNLDFAERAEVAASLRPAPVAVISLHFNALNGREKGTVAMVGARPANANYARDAAFARELTEEVSDVVRNYVPGSEARPTIDDGHLHGGKGSNFFYQMARHPSLDFVPKCFLEVEFIDTNEAEEKLLARKSDAFKEIAEAIARVIVRQADTLDGAPSDR